MVFDMVYHGVVLGPILFLLHINDVASSSSFFKFFLFADDTSLFSSCKNMKSLELQINKEHDNISERLITNKLTLSVCKSNIIFYNKANKTKHSLDLNISGELLKQKDFTKYLGVLTDDQLGAMQNL